MLYNVSFSQQVFKIVSSPVEKTNTQYIYFFKLYIIYRHPPPLLFRAISPYNFVFGVWGWFMFSPRFPPIGSSNKSKTSTVSTGQVTDNLDMKETSTGTSGKVNCACKLSFSLNFSLYPTLNIAHLKAIGAVRSSVNSKSML